MKKQLLLIFLLIGCNQESIEPSSQSEYQKEVQDETNFNLIYAKEVLRLVNIEREKEGLLELEWDSNLANATDIRATEIQLFFSHTRLDGSECFTAVNNKKKYHSLGENIASGYINPESVMEGWMNSTGHKENILYKGFTKLGVSCFVDETGRFHWAQMFGG